MDTLAPVRWLARPEPAAPLLRFDPADFSPALKTRLLVLQATPFCNIDCDYCYLPQRNSKERMSIDTVRQAAWRLRADGLVADALTVVWHAGEPLSMPRDFYDEAAAVLREVLGSACEVSFAMQTNATLIDDAWCALFERLKVRVGVSLDGPAALHDPHRRTRQGRGTHAAALRGLARLRAHGIAHKAIAVVSGSSLSQPDGFADFFLQQGVRDVGINIDEAEGAHAASSLSGAGLEAAYATFLDRLALRCAASEGQLRLRELERARAVIESGLPNYRWRDRCWPANDQVMPFALVTVACNGDFGSFSPEWLGMKAPLYRDFVLGNVARQGFFDAAREPAFRLLWSAIVEGVAACEQRCEHFMFCGGGAPVNKFCENADLGSTETLYCRTGVKRPFDLMLAMAESELRSAPVAIASSP